MWSGGFRFVLHARPFRIFSAVTFLPVDSRTDHVRLFSTHNEMAEDLRAKFSQAAATLVPDSSQIPVIPEELLENDRIVQFLQWFCDDVHSTNILTADELTRYCIHSSHWYYTIMIFLDVRTLNLLENLFRYVLYSLKHYYYIVKVHTYHVGLLLIPPMIPIIALYSWISPFNCLIPCSYIYQDSQ